MNTIEKTICNGRKYLHNGVKMGKKGGQSHSRMKKETKYQRELKKGKKG